MTSESSPWLLRVEAASYVIGFSTLESLQQAAVEALEHMPATPSLAELGGRPRAVFRDDLVAAKELFGQALDELEIATPSIDQSIMMLLATAIAPIARREVDPVKGCDRLAAILTYDQYDQKEAPWLSTLDVKARKYGLKDFQLMFQALTDGCEPWNAEYSRHVSECKQEMIVLAGEWMKIHYPND